MKNSNKEKTKIAIIGCGFVGSTIAFSLTATVHPDEIVLIDCDGKKAQAEALDIAHGLDEAKDVNVFSGAYSDISGSSLIIITAGRNRKPGEDRNDLLKDNLIVSKIITKEIGKYYTGCPILIVSNPVDTLVCAYTKWLNLPEGVVFGTGCSLDSFRLSTYLSDYFQIPTNRIESCIIGEHGNDFEIIWRFTKIDGVPIDEYCHKNNISWSVETKKEIEKRIKEAGMNVIMGKGRTQFGISTVVCSITNAILKNKRSVFSVSSVLKNCQSSYPFYDISISLPAIIGCSGREAIVDINLNQKEKKSLIDIARKLNKIKEEHNI